MEVGKGENWQASTECTAKKKKKAFGQPADAVFQLWKFHGCVGVG